MSEYYGHLDRDHTIYDGDFAVALYEGDHLVLKRYGADVCAIRATDGSVSSLVDSLRALAAEIEGWWVEANEEDEGHPMREYFRQVRDDYTRAIGARR